MYRTPYFQFGNLGSNPKWATKYWIDNITIMKTIRQWLKELPEPYKKQALMNLTTIPYRSGIDNEDAGSMRGALYVAFEWDKSPEGHYYWEDLKDKY